MSGNDHEVKAWSGSDGAAQPRPFWRALARGLGCRCPHCGEGRLFAGFLSVAPACEACGEDLSHQRADDAPPYFVIFITGHIVVPLSLSVEFNFAPPYWLHLVIWLPLTLILAIGLLRPVKGAVVAAQWALRMHGFGEDSELPQTSASADSAS